MTSPMEMILRLHDYTGNSYFYLDKYHKNYSYNTKRYNMALKPLLFRTRQLTGWFCSGNTFLKN